MSSRQKRAHRPETTDRRGSGGVDEVHGKPLGAIHDLNEKRVIRLGVVFRFRKRWFFRPARNEDRPHFRVLGKLDAQELLASIPDDETSRRHREPVPGKEGLVLRGVDRGFLNIDDTVPRHAKRQARLGLGADVFQRE